WTIEYKFKFLNAVPLGQGLVTGAWFYNSGDAANTDPIGRTRHQFGTIDGTADADLGFEVVFADGNRYNTENPIGAWPVDEWQTVRVNFDNTDDFPYMSMYLNGGLVKTVTHSSPGGSLMGGQDDPILNIGASDGGTAMDVEWDYVRIKTGSVVPNGEPLNAVPEPSSFAMLGLAGLALLRRRS
ncbi:MAG: PEP-CTERM sorting domain-containing protein, partial [Planctomycetota bacterium]|nr:PEP-CTERM sorting domain-containing protein [Planctomycetota bacterium]